VEGRYAWLVWSAGFEEKGVGVFGGAYSEFQKRKIEMVNSRFATYTSDFILCKSSLNFPRTQIYVREWKLVVALKKICTK
jgi:hypothetical protein